MTFRIIAAGILTIVLFAVVWPRYNFYTLTGRFSPIKKIETLQSPMAVKNWTTNGLLLADGRAFALPGVHSLPAKSPALTEVTKRGVEITRDGRLFGLVKVHHWCGNDPVREHIAKVDISDMLIYLKVGEPTSPLARTDYPEYVIKEAGGAFSEYGWNISDYLGFTSWVSLKNSGL